MGFPFPSSLRNDSVEPTRQFDDVVTQVRPEAAVQDYDQPQRHDVGAPKGERHDEPIGNFPLHIAVWSELAFEGGLDTYLDGR